MARSMVSVWASMARENPSKPAITVGDGPTVSWKELHARTNRLARAFGQAGVGYGDLVTIGLPTSLAAVEAILASIKLGAVPNVVSSRLPPPERRQIIELADPRLVIDDSAESLTSHPVLTSDWQLDDLSDEDLPEVISPSLKAPTSGGSTGRPKIILSGMPAVVAPELFKLGGVENSCCLFPGPLYHNTACTGLLFGLGFANHIVLEERFDPELTLRLIERHRVEFTILVPTMMNRIWRLPATVRDAYDLSSLKMVVHNAAPCPPDLKRAWIEWLGADRIYENYAATEQSAITVVSGREWLERPGTVGKVALGEIEIRDDDGRVCSPGEVGTIWMRRPAGTPRTFRYIGEQTPEDDDRWETVGDLGHMDEGGYIFLADRRADLIISGGSNIYPAEVEATIAAHPKVIESVVIGIPDYDMGQLVHAVVSVADVSLSEDELDRFVRSRLSGTKCPKSYEFTTAALRDDAGKVRRSKVREDYLQRHPMH